MKSFTLEMDAQIAEQLLPILEKQRLDMQEKLSGIEAQIAKIRKGLQSATSGVADSRPTPPVVAVPVKAPGGKAKKGESRKVIVECLKSLKGHGVTTKDVSDKTGTNYSTAYRILNFLKEEETVELKDDLWIWAE